MLFPSACSQALFPHARPQAHATLTPTLKLTFLLALFLHAALAPLPRVPYAPHPPLNYPSALPLEAYPGPALPPYPPCEGY
ncbi:hypothetical protein NL676_025684 [Syzygium grande]|nr:hypothetical protein NL676_025684 [Syzygium grande]